jgi:hypothetical protein
MADPDGCGRRSRHTGTLLERLARTAGALRLTLADLFSIRHDSKVRREIGEIQATGLSCPVCGRGHDDATGTIACMTAHVTDAADMHAELNDIIRAVEDQDN